MIAFTWKPGRNEDAKILGRRVSLDSCYVSTSGNLGLIYGEHS